MVKQFKNPNLNDAQTRSLERDLQHDFHLFASMTNDDQLITAIGLLNHHIYKYIVYVPRNVRTDLQKKRFLKDTFLQSLRSTTDHAHFKKQAFPSIKHVFNLHTFVRKFYNDNLKQEFQRMVLVQDLPAQLKRHTASFIF